VVGLDYNADYVAEARRRWGSGQRGNLSFEVADLLALAPAGAPFHGARFDAIVMIDLFLFLFNERFQPALHSGRVDVMRTVGTMLNSDGLLAIMDPHPLWLTPWVGSDNQPFGLLTEYRKRRFKVAPTVQEATDLLFRSGWRIRRILEPDIDPAYAKIDPAGCSFMADVPQWWCIEAEPAPSPIPSA
jgi:hypothetical protein